MNNCILSTNLNYAIRLYYGLWTIYWYKEGEVNYKVLAIKIPPKNLACKYFKCVKCDFLMDFAWLLKCFVGILTPQIQIEEYN